MNNTTTTTTTGPIDNSTNNNNRHQLGLLFKTEYPILIPYQIDFHTGTIGKHISLTKRFCVWRFGFAHVSDTVNNVDYCTVVGN